MNDATAAKPSAQTLLLVDDDENVVRGLAALLERPGRTIVTCTDVEATRLVLERCPVSLIVSDVRLSGPFGFEGLSVIDDAAEKVPRCPVVLMTGNATSDLEREARARGAIAVLQKPLDGALIEALLGDADEHSHADVVHVPSIDDVLSGELLTAHYQPLHRLQGGAAQLYAYEALARLLDASILRNPETLFRYAASKRRLEELDLLCLERAIAGAASLVPSTMLFANVHPATLGSSLLAKIVLAACDRHRIDPRRLVIEITEQSSISAIEPAIDQVERLRAAGVRFAFDDVGVAYSHLPLIDQIRPSFFKVSQAFGLDCELVAAKSKIVRNIVSLAADFGCEVILEGVESPATLEFARSVGVHYAQGFQLGRPAPATEWTRLTQLAS